jgi:hypothetical protein
MQLDETLPSGVCPVVYLPTSRFSVREAMTELAIHGLWEFSEHVQLAGGHVFMSMDAGKKGKTEVYPIIMSCLQSPTPADLSLFRSVYRVVASIKSGGKTGKDADNMLKFAISKVQSLINVRYGDEACTIELMATTLDGASDNRRLAILNPQTTSPHCQMHILSLLLSNSYEPGFGAAHQQPQTKRSVISLLKNLSYLIHDIIGISSWKACIKKAKEKFDNNGSSGLGGLEFETEELEWMWKELQNYDGCVMFTR